MTRVSVDPDKCRAYGLCVSIQPDVFDLPAGSPTAVVIREIIDADDREDVDEAMRACPAQAITVVDD